MTPREIALRLFNEQNRNCAQSVLAAHGPDLGLDETSCLRVSACFGAGLGRLGLTCGAVTGACMVLGLRHAAEMNEGMPGRDRVYGRVQEFTRRFRELHGATDCITLTKCDMTTPEGRQPFAERGLLKNLCSTLVACAVDLLAEIPA